MASRQGITTDDADGSAVAADENDPGLTRAQRIAAFRQRNLDGISNPGIRKTTLKAVHLLGTHEIAALFGDITAGLAFLVSGSAFETSSGLISSCYNQHGKSLLHLDLKPGNVLLTYDAASLTLVQESKVSQRQVELTIEFSPRAMLSDFGASKDMIQQSTNARTGITGTCVDLLKWVGDMLIDM